jgi:hypothetical protein
MAVILMFCKFCNKEILSDRRKDSKFCSDLCRGRNFELNHPDRKMYRLQKKTQNKGVEGVGNNEVSEVKQ